MSVTLELTGDITFFVTGTGDSTCSGAYILVHTSGTTRYFLNQYGRTLVWGVPANTVHIYGDYTLTTTLYYNNDFGVSGFTADAGAAPAPSSVVYDDESIYSVTAPGLKIYRASGAGDDVVNTDYIVWRHQRIGLDESFMAAGWNNGEYVQMLYGDYYGASQIATYTDILYTSNRSVDPTGTWNASGLGTSPGPTVVEYFPPILPTFGNASISRDGLKFTLNWATVSVPPITGSTGLTLGNLLHGAATLSNITNSGTTTAADISRAIQPDESPTVSYTPGDFEDSNENAASAFVDQPVTNYAGTSSGGFLMMF